MLQNLWYIKPLLSFTRNQEREKFDGEQERNQKEGVAGEKREKQRVKKEKGQRIEETSWRYSYGLFVKYYRLCFKRLYWTVYLYFSGQDSQQGGNVDAKSGTLKNKKQKKKSKVAA